MKSVLASITAATLLFGGTAQAQGGQPEEKHPKAVRIFNGVVGGVLGGGAIAWGATAIGAAASAPVAVTVATVGLAYVTGAMGVLHLAEAITGKPQPGIAKWSGLDAFQRGLIRTINLVLPERHREVPHGIYEPHVFMIDSGANSSRNAETRGGAVASSSSRPSGGASSAGMSRR